MSTGQTTGRAILNARITALLAEGYSAAAITSSTVSADLSKSSIVNSWGAADYSTGHISGAFGYVPKADLKSTTFMKTLPTNHTVVVYCNTRQTSSIVTADLRLLGFDAKTLSCGANAMIYDTMPGTKFVPATETKGYPYALGP